MNTSPEHHTTIEAAYADGWERCYIGTQRTGRNAHVPREPRVYGYKPGNHRLWRCYVQHTNLSRQRAGGGGAELAELGNDCKAGETPLARNVRVSNCAEENHTK